MNKESLVNLDALKELEMGPNWEDDNKITNEPKNGVKKQRVRKRKEYSPRTKSYQNKFFVNPLPKFDIITELLNKVRKVAITYEMNEIFDVFVKDKNKLHYKVSWQQEDKKFYITKFNKEIIDNKETLISYIMQYQIEEYFEKEIIEDDNKLPNFDSMLKCPETKQLLPPKSYHDFEKYTVEHIHENNIAVDFEKYCNKLETIKETNEIRDFQNKKKLKRCFTKKNKMKQSYTLIDIKNDISENKGDFYFYEQDTLKLNYEQIQSLKFNVEINFSKINMKNLLYKNIIIALKQSGFHLIKINKMTYATWIKNKIYDFNILSELSKKIIIQVKRKPLTKKKTLLESINVNNATKKNVLLEIKFLVKEGYLREFSDSTIAIA